MPLYLNQFTYTADAWAALVKHPADRTEVVRTLVEQVGGRLLSMHYCFGEYDGVMLVEAPDEHAISSALIAAIAPGHIKAMKTTTLISPEAMVDVLRRAAELSFSGPARGLDQRPTKLAQQSVATAPSATAIGRHDAWLRGDDDVAVTLS